MKIMKNVKSINHSPKLTHEQIKDIQQLFYCLLYNQYFQAELIAAKAVNNREPRIYWKVRDALAAYRQISRLREYVEMLGVQTIGEEYKKEEETYCKSIDDIPNSIFFTKPMKKFWHENSPFESEQTSE
jgi:hypothetical protein